MSFIIYLLLLIHLIIYCHCTCHSEMSEKQFLKSGAKADNPKVAQECFSLCTKKFSDSLECHFSLGKSLLESGEYELSHPPLFKAVQLENSPRTWEMFKRSYSESGFPELMLVDLGILNLENGVKQRNYPLVEKAKYYFDKALEINPSCLQAHMYLFNIYQNLIPNPKLSLLHVTIAAQIEDNDIYLLEIAGSRYFGVKNFFKSMEYYEKAYRLNSTIGTIASTRSYIKQLISNWTEMKEDFDYVIKLTRKELKNPDFLETSLHPFQALSYPVDCELRLELTRRYAKRELAAAAKGGLKPFSHDPKLVKKRNHSRLHVAYISSDFRSKVASYLLQNYFGYHDRKNFQIFCIATTSDDKSFYRRKIAAQCEHFIDVSNQRDADVVQLINQKYEIDILIDVDGYSNQFIRRTPIIAVQPAPIQIHFLIHPSTFGADYIQYLVADPFVIPPENQKYFHEKIIYMPHYYLVNSHMSIISTEQKAIQDEKIPTFFDHNQFIERKENGVIKNGLGETRETFGLPKKGFVFASFNNNYKYDPEIWDLWMSLLHSVKGSVLWILKVIKESEMFLRKEAAIRGITDPSRIIFADFVNDQTTNLRRIRFADLVLDTFVYGAHTTCSDSLFAGTPVVSLAGNTFASRVCAGQLHVIGLPQFVANTTQQYKDIILKAAQDKKFLTDARTHLDKVRNTTVLFDTQLYVKQFEKGLKKIWKIYLKEEAPRHIYVDDKTEKNVDLSHLEL
eukprot:c8025_g1_i1.p1 GENE.c8025_g1_i1~~c8025_g1_i1.p1  ORF type:complete len:793 (+),score=227.53 c8025_g1_i1:176-2380(+)